MKTSTFAILATLAVLLSGSFWVGGMILFERRERVEIAQEIRTREIQIAKLRRTNEELSVKIAEQENPSWLGRRASNRLVRADAKLVVWGFENFKNGRIEFSPNNQKVLSFRLPERNESKATAR